MVKQEFQSVIISSGLLKRQVKVDIYHPTLYGELSSMNVLFINDGQGQVFELSHPCPRGAR